MVRTCLGPTRAEELFFIYFPFLNNRKALLGPCLDEYDMDRRVEVYGIIITNVVHTNLNLIKLSKEMFAPC